jgi:acyl-CoA reductase-like NAD-dependent aldehyde dehydrogenase
VNSIWMPAIALKTPVVLKPGREEPWTPLRIVRAFLAAGCPRAAFSFYPTDHQGAATILERCGRAQLFGDEQTTAAYASNPRIERHGPGRSKVILGADCAEAWREHLGVLVDSVALNGGRSCVNASAILTPAHARSG